MSDSRNTFEDEARRVRYAYKSTQSHYDQHPPHDDVVPIAAAINAWTLICGCYMGIEQTIKLLILMRGGRPELTHPLATHYALLGTVERDMVAKSYRVYRSLHNFDSGGLDIETADKFIQHIGNGYVAWRYILIETPSRVPKVHLGLMLEMWRALVDVVERLTFGAVPRTVADFLEDYVSETVVRAAEMDDKWQAASLDENNATAFRGVRDWVNANGGDLVAGIELFQHCAQGTGESMQASPLLRRVLLRAACNASWAHAAHMERRADLAMFHYRIRNGGLRWNAAEGVFE